MDQAKSIADAVALQENVKFLDRATTLYTEGPRSLRVLVEYLGDHTVLLYLKKLSTWDSPLESIALLPADKERVRAALRKAYATEHMKVEFDDDAQRQA